jgi:hypothetical protein
MKKQILYYSFTLFALLCFASTAICEMTSTSYRVTTSVFGGVGKSMSSANYQSNSTMGQPSPLMDPSFPPYSTNYDNFPGFWNTAADNDGDGLLNALEDVIGLNPGDADHDNDGLLDGAEDADHDGIVDATETDPGDADTDDDTWSDGDEVAAGTDPLDPNDYPDTIPTLSEWGMIILMLFLIIAGVVVIRRQQEQ